MLPFAFAGGGRPFSPCGSLLSHSDFSDKWVVAYVNLLKLALEGVDETESHAFGHFDRTQIKTQLLNKIASSNSIIDPLHELAKFTSYSPKLSFLVESRQFDEVIENISDEEMPRLRALAQELVATLSRIQEQQTTARPATQNNFEDPPAIDGTTRLQRLVKSEKYEEAYNLITQNSFSKRYLNYRTSNQPSALVIVQKQKQKIRDLNLNLSSHTKEYRLKLIVALRKQGALSEKQLSNLNLKFHNATAGNRVDEMRRLYSLGADVNAKNPASSATTPIFLALHLRHIDAIRELVRLGVDINTLGFDQENPVMFAIIQALPLEIVLALLEGKPNLELMNLENQTAFTIAFLKGRVDIMEALVAHGAHPKITALDKHSVPLENTFERVKSLVSLNVDLNATMVDGNTLLHPAVSAINYHFVKALLENGANPLTPNRRGKTPKELIHTILESLGPAGYTSFSEILALLEKYEQR